MGFGIYLPSRAQYSTYPPDECIASSAWASTHFSDLEAVNGFSEKLPTGVIEKKEESVRAKIEAIRE